MLLQYPSIKYVDEQSLDDFIPRFSDFNPAASLNRLLFINNKVCIECCTDQVSVTVTTKKVPYSNDQVPYHNCDRFLITPLVVSISNKPVTANMDNLHSTQYNIFKRTCF